MLDVSTPNNGISCTGEFVKQRLDKLEQEAILRILLDDEYKRQSTAKICDSYEMNAPGEIEYCNYNSNSVYISESVKDKIDISNEVDIPQVDYFNLVNIDDFFTAREAQNNETIENAGSNISSIGETGYVSYDDAWRSIVNSKYAILVEQARQSADPEQFIYNRYYAADSIYYVEGLTDIERSRAYKNEMTMYKDGYINCIYCDDAVFRNYKEIQNYNYDSADEADFTMRLLSKEVTNYLGENGVNGLEESSINISYNAFTKTATVTCDNEETQEKVDTLLNEKGTMTSIFKLIDHAYLYHDHQQDNQSLKFYVWDRMDEVTGYNIKYLEEGDGTYYTEDGTDIRKIYKAKLKDYFPDSDDDYLDNDYSHMCQYLQTITDEGFNTNGDIILELSYENGNLKYTGSAFWEK